MEWVIKRSLMQRKGILVPLGSRKYVPLPAYFESNIHRYATIQVVSHRPLVGGRPMGDSGLTGPQDHRGHLTAAWVAHGRRRFSRPRIPPRSIDPLATYARYMRFKNLVASGLARAARYNLPTALAWPSRCRCWCRLRHWWGAPTIACPSWCRPTSMRARGALIRELRICAVPSSARLRPTCHFRPQRREFTTGSARHRAEAPARGCRRVLSLQQAVSRGQAFGQERLCAQQRR